MKAGRSVVFFNFRSDRAREITEAMTETEFTDFNRKRRLQSFGLRRNGLTMTRTSRARASLTDPQNI